MNSDYEYFVNLVGSVESLASSELRGEILSQSVDFWSPSRWWEWKQSNSESFAHFIVLATRSLDGSENDDIATTLIDNLYITVPWCVENVAELSMLLLEEFIDKKISRIGLLLQYAQDQFGEHPDFSDRKPELFKEIKDYQAVVNRLKFNHISPTSISEVCKR